MNKLKERIVTLLYFRLLFIYINQLEEVNVEDLVEGDLVNLIQGSRVPADLRLVEVNGLRIDESILTGEHKPSRKVTNAIEGYDYY